MVFLSNAGLLHLQSYKYASSHAGYLDNVIMEPFWNTIVLYVPLYIAPNLLTLISFISAILIYILINIYIPTLNENSPYWIYLLFAFSIFFYQTFDAIDGKQARRTKAGSPLGQLFDHGCDALNTWLTGVTVCGCLRLGNTYFTIIFYICGLIMFFMSNFEESQTHKMRFGILSVTEAQFTSILLMLITAYFGSDIWLLTYNIEFYGSSYVLQLNYTLCCISMLMVAYSFIESILMVYNHNPKITSFLYSCTALLPLTFVISVMCIAAYLQPLYLNYIRLYLGIMGVLFGFLTSKLIICTVTGMAYDQFMPIYSSLLLLFGGYLNEKALEIFLYSHFIYVFIIYSHYVLNVIHEIKTHLDIFVFVIKKKD